MPVARCRSPCGDVESVAVVGEVDDWLAQESIMARATSERMGDRTHTIAARSFPWSASVVSTDNVTSRNARGSALALESLRERDLLGCTRVRLFALIFAGAIIGCGGTVVRPDAAVPPQDGSTSDAVVDGGPVCTTSSSAMPQATCDFRWGNGDLQEPQAVATDSAGDMLIVGGFGGTLTFGPDTIVGPDTSPQMCDPDGCSDQGFAVLFNASCEPQWALAFDGGAPYVMALPGNRFAIAYVSFTDGFWPTNVVVLDALGHTVWSRQFVGTAPNNTIGFTDLSMTSDHGGNIVLAGTLVGTVDFGGGPLSSGPQLGSELGVLVKLDAAGNFVFNSTFATSALASFQGWSAIGPMSVDEAGQVWLVGTLAPGFGSVDFGGEVFQAADDASDDIWLGYVARLSTSDGHYLGGVSFDDVRMAGLVSDPCTGRTTVVGWADGGIDFGLGPIAGGGGFVLQLDNHGNAIWNQAAPTTDWSSVAVDGEGNVVAVGSFFAADSSIWATDVVLNGYDLSGNTRFSFSWPSMMSFGADSGGASPAAVTVGSDGSIGIVGGVGSYTTITFGLGLLPEEIDAGAPYGPSTDGFFVRFH